MYEPVLVVDINLGRMYARPCSLGTSCQHLGICSTSSSYARYCLPTSLIPPILENSKAVNESG